MEMDVEVEVLTKGMTVGRFMIDVEIPQSVHDLEEMRTIWAELCRSVSWVNDLVSLKKEIVSPVPCCRPIHSSTRIF